MRSQATVEPRDVAAAAERIRGHVRQTPVEHSPALSEACGGDVWLKCECFQETGSFKLRGALNRLLTLDPRETAGGVVTVSAGNHGLGVSEAASRLNVRATVVVPRTASTAKVKSLQRYATRGVELIQYGDDYDAAEQYGLGLARATGRAFISGYNDAAVIAGGGTVGLEALDAVPDADVIVVPAGGGGLIAGIGIWTKSILPDVRVIGVQPAASPALKAALAAGAVTSIPVGYTLADGLAGNIEDGSITVPLARRVVDDVVLVSEDEIAEAMRWTVREHHFVVEGSAATAVAAIHAGLAGSLVGKRVVAILTGRNVAYDTLREVISASGSPQAQAGRDHTGAMQ
jgi:threonine dehydratase